VIRSCMVVCCIVNMIWSAASGASGPFATHYIAQVTFADAPLAPTDDSKHFALRKGEGIAVCAAYLKLLNSTTFDRTPFCGRPEEGPVNGFTPLERRYLNADEILVIYKNVLEFMTHNDQLHAEKFFNPYIGSWEQNPITISEIQTFLTRNWMRVWTYARPLDIENNGSPVNLLIWQGYGATDTGSVCGGGQDDDHPWDFQYTDQRAFVLASDARSIDEIKTREIFGRIANPATSASPHVRKGDQTVRPGFRPVADTIGVFKYDGRYYIQVENKPPSAGDGLPPIRVMLREHTRTSEICLLVPQDVPRFQ
jgi:hypothetical protein